MNKYLGDGWLACWLAGPESAAQVAATVRAFRELREMAEPKFRLIVHRGEVAVGGEASVDEECLMGPEVNFIFRVEKVAGGTGAAFCFTSGARALLASLLVLEPIPGRNELKGFEGGYEFFPAAVVHPNIAARFIWQTRPSPPSEKWGEFFCPPRFASRRAAP